MEENKDIRWIQRLSNFSSAYTLLRGELLHKNVDQFNQLEQEGLVQRFEYTFELMWKTMKDYLQAEEVEITIISPKNVIKAAGQSGLLEAADADGEVLLEMLESRNMLTHTYDFERFKAILEKIKKDYLAQIERVYKYFEGAVKL